MESQVVKELTDLQNELKRLKKATDHIDDAKELAIRLSESSDKLQVGYTEHLNGIDGLLKSFQSYSEKSGELASKIHAIDFPNLFDGLNEEIGQVRGNVNGVEDKMRAFTKDIKDLDIGNSLVEMRNDIHNAGTNLDKLSNVLSDINMPTRMDKLDAAVVGINQGLQNNQLKLENLSREIRDGLRRIEEGIEESKKSMSIQIEKNGQRIAAIATEAGVIKEELKVSKIFSIASIVLIVATLVVLIIKLS